MSSACGPAESEAHRVEAPSSDEAPRAPELRAFEAPPVDSHELLTEASAIANERHWSEEHVSSTLTATALLDLRALLRGPRADVPRLPELTDVFTADARVGLPRPNAFEEQPLALEVVRRRWSGDESGELVPLVTPAAWWEAVRELQAEARRVRWALVKPRAVERTDFGVRVGLYWHLNRELLGGGLQHDKGAWTSEWVEVGEDEWRCRRLEPESDCVSLVSSAPHFVDATLDAFAGTALDPRLPTRRERAARRGLALADLDDDGDLDLVVSVSQCVLYNRGDGTFEDRSAQVLVDERGEASSREGAVAPRERVGIGGVIVADFDRDGAPDIVMAARGGPMTLYLQRDGRFHARDIPSSYTDNFPASLAAHDVDGDGWLDLFVSGYGPFFDPGPNDFTNAVNGRRNQMLRGRPGGEFEDVTRAWGVDAESSRWTFAGAFADPDEDGDVDLYVANDFGPNVLYRNAPTSTGAVHFVAEIESPEHIDSGFSMSATWADLDGDLDLDMYVSNMSSTAANRVRKMPGNPEERELGVDMNDIRRRMSKGNTLVLNEGGRFVEAGAERGGKNASWAWGTALFDYDMDGDLDIHCLNGFWTRGVDDGRDL